MSPWGMVSVNLPSHKINGLLTQLSIHSLTPREGSSVEREFFELCRRSQSLFHQHDNLKLICFTGF